MYSTNDREDAAEKARFDENLRNFRSGGANRRDEPLTTEQERAMRAQEVNGILDELDELIADDAKTAAFTTSYQHPAAHFALDDKEIAEIEALKQPISPAYVTPYDRAFTHRIEIERRLEAVPAHDHRQRKLLEWQLADAKQKCALELKRERDDDWRKLHRIDEWRAEHPDEYNASRRKVRAEPNAQRITADQLAEMTEEQIAAHKRAIKKKSKARKLAAETPEQAAERKRRDAERKRAKRAAEKAKASD